LTGVCKINVSLTPVYQSKPSTKREDIVSHSKYNQRGKLTPST